jgi:hypothetical protein
VRRSLNGLSRSDCAWRSKRETPLAYDEALAELGGAAPLGQAPRARSSFWRYSTLLDPTQYGDVRRLIPRANQAGIQLRPLS